MFLNRLFKSGQKHNEERLLAAKQQAAEWNKEIGWREYSAEREVQDAKDKAHYEPIVSGVEEGHEFVDLGLPSGKKWAVCNIGAKGANGSYSKRFKWLEDTSNDNEFYSPFNVYESYAGIDNEKCLVFRGDGRQTLSVLDDAATESWGGQWSMPTAADYEELINNCTAQHAECGKKDGIMLTGPNGNNIFFPYLSIKDDDDYLKTKERHPAMYWSSTAQEKCHSYVFAAGHNNDDQDSLVIKLMDAFREVGMPIRPILGCGRDHSAECEIQDALGKGQYEPIVSGQEEGHEFVDLGLPSGKKWAVCNIGAKGADGSDSKLFTWIHINPYRHNIYKEEEGFDYPFNYSSFKMGDSGWKREESDLPFYEHLHIRKDEEGNPIDHGCWKVAEYGWRAHSDYDGAAMFWGRQWSVPTAADFEELINNCTAQYAQCGKKDGIMLTGPNGNKLFFPYLETEHPVMYRSSTPCMPRKSLSYCFTTVHNSDENQGSLVIKLTKADNWDGMPIRPILG